MRFILDIKLRGIEDPVIWRKMAVPTVLTFHELHLMIQAAMGWEHQHLYSFTEHPESRYFMIVSPYAEEFGADATKISASNILWSYLNQYPFDEEAERDKLYYEYDYGDSWVHEIDVLDLDRSNSKSAELLDGAGACPPENCGGTPGFQLLKDHLSGKISPEEYFDNFFAANPKGYDIHKVDLKRLGNRVKRWRMLDR